MLETLLPIIKDVGILAVLVLYFVWRDWKREDRMAERINVLEDYIRGELTGLVRGYESFGNKVLEILGDLVEAIKSRRCLVDDWEAIETLYKQYKAEKGE